MAHYGVLVRSQEAFHHGKPRTLIIKVGRAKTQSIASTRLMHGWMEGYEARPSLLSRRAYIKQTVPTSKIPSWEAHAEQLIENIFASLIVERKMKQSRLLRHVLEESGIWSTPMVC